MSTQRLARTIITVAAEHESRPKSEVNAIPSDLEIPGTHSSRSPLLTRQIKRYCNSLVMLHRCDRLFLAAGNGTREEEGQAKTIWLCSHKF